MKTAREAYREQLAQQAQEKAARPPAQAEPGLKRNGAEDLDALRARIAQLEADKAAKN